MHGFPTGSLPLNALFLVKSVSAVRSRWLALGRAEVGGLAEDKGQHQKVLWGTFPSTDCSPQPGRPGTEPAQAGVRPCCTRFLKHGVEDRNGDIQSSGLRAKRVLILVLPLAIFLPERIACLCGLGFSSVRW